MFAQDDGESTPSYISIPFATTTGVYLAAVPAAINGSRTIAGNYVDPKGQHGFVRDAHGAITSFDVAGNATVAVAGINSAGEITGYYFGNGTYHGFARDPRERSHRSIFRLAPQPPPWNQRCREHNGVQRRRPRLAQLCARPPRELHYG